MPPGAPDALGSRNHHHRPLRASIYFVLWKILRRRARKDEYDQF